MLDLYQRKVLDALPSVAWGGSVEHSAVNTQRKNGKKQ